MSRPEGTAMQAKPGTDMICDMIRPGGMSLLEGTAMQTKPGTGMIFDMIRSEVMSAVWARPSRPSLART